MTIKEMTVYKPELTETDVESIANTVNILYQFKNYPKVWESIQAEAVNEGVKNVSLTDMISALEEIGGDKYIEYQKKIH